ncbi:MAG: transposase [Hydrogenophaga sp.]|uniref:transposase n=1 Tax=Hydrogenophaga sp. TaxID=1904254 RepID=UPI001DF42AAC|nr:transposase [Hydrogenophaga sp.]MBX3611756.1 transposase [Hydrogenophaga sp.]
MARLPRLTLPNVAHLVSQRGNGRQAIVLDNEDREALVGLILQQAKGLGVALHAWALLEDRLLLLATPTTPDGVPKMMQAIGRSYVRRFNQRHQRRGTLWEGRYRSTVVQAERHMIDCMAYVEWQPVRAGLAAEARDYAWSSHRQLVGLEQSRGLSPPAAYWALGNTPFAREEAYRERVRAGLPQALERQIADAVEHGWALGDEAFLQALQRVTPRRPTRARRGRPPAQTPETVSR